MDHACNPGVRSFAVFIPALSLFFLAALFPSFSSDERDLRIRADCVAATIRAIGMEIGNTAMKIDAARNGPGNPANLPSLQARKDELEKELRSYVLMEPKDYVLPEPRTVRITVTTGYGPGSLLELDDMSKSGPFLHLAGIGGDDWSVLQPGGRYTLTVYPVYRREYVLPFAQSLYVHAVAPGREGTAGASTPPGPARKHPVSTDPWTIGEMILAEPAAGNGTFSFTAQSNGCTSRGSFRIEVRREEGIDPRTPHYALTVYRSVVDSCKALVPEGVRITVDLAKELGITGTYTFSLTNHLASKFPRW